MLAPIVLFVYNRPEHTKNTIEALKNNRLAKDSELFIFSDGPKNEAAAEKVRAVRELIKKIDGFKKINIIERDKNIGLAASIIDGVTSIVNQYGKIIVLEDDLITHPHFLKFMNDALDKYEKEDRVMQVSGFMYNVDLDVKYDALFLPLFTTWGWATWQRAWEHYDPEARGYETLKKDLGMIKRFNAMDNYDFFNMLKDQMEGRLNTWGIKWYLSCFINEGICLFPAKTLVINEGFDGSGINCGPSDYFLSQSFGKNGIDLKLPDEIEVIENKNPVYNDLRKLYGRGNFKWAILKIVRYFKFLFPWL